MSRSAGDNDRKRALYLLNELSSLYDGPDARKPTKRSKKKDPLPDKQSGSIYTNALANSRPPRGMGLHDEDIGEMIVSHGGHDSGKDAGVPRDTPKSEQTDVLCKSDLLWNLFPDTPAQTVTNRVSRPLYLDYLTGTSGGGSIATVRDNALRERREAMKRKRQKDEKKARMEEHQTRQRIAQLQKEIHSSAESARTITTGPDPFFTLTASGIVTNQAPPSPTPVAPQAPPVITSEHGDESKGRGKESKFQCRKSKREALVPQYGNLSEVMGLHRSWWNHCYQALATQYIGIGSSRKGASQTYVQNASLTGEKASISNIIRAKAETKRIAKGWALHLSNRASKRLDQAAAMGVKVEVPPPPKPKDLPSSLSPMDLADIITRSVWEEHIPSVTKGWKGAWVTLLRHDYRAIPQHTSGFVVGVTKCSLFLAVLHALDAKENRMEEKGRETPLNDKSNPGAQGIRLGDIRVRIQRFAKKSTRLFIHLPTTPKPRGLYSTDVTKLPEMVTGDSVLLEMDANYLCSDEEASLIMTVV